MYEDEYFPNFLVDKLREIIKEVVALIEEGVHSKDAIQQALDAMTLKTNDLQEES